MTEKIQKLAEHAGAWFPQGYPSAEGGDEAWKNSVIFEKADLVKFTQLIVQECIDIVKPTQHHEAHAQSYLGGMEGLELLDQKIQDIRQHLGEPQ
jgi:hypothetical protein